uniref:Sulfatase N-terminal domain-containing protein n=1 Tax=Clytia hemisphaerica TaxID=252671 RepID=A0A7M5VG10_9CNID
MEWLLMFLFLLSAGSILANAEQPPHIVLIVADDLGWNDVGFHGSDQIPTPNIDKLAKEGIILNNYYVQPICTPTRSALMTGRYPIHTGLFEGVIYPVELYGLSLDEKILPQYLKELGYTHAFGKWHLGYFAKEYTPTYRGFDSFYGYYTGAEDYFYHNRSGLYWPEFRGLDLHHDVNGKLEPVHHQDGNYSTRMYTSEAIEIINQQDKETTLFLYLPYQNVHGRHLQAPQKWIDHFSHIKHEKRRILAAMMATLDEAVGKVHKALWEKGMLDNTVIIFTSDNGAEGQDFSSNYPLKGCKFLLYEGGVRVPAFINSPLLKRSGVTSMQMMHVTDWLPTIVNLAQGKITKEIDGFDQWKTLQDDVKSPRNEILLNIDHLENLQEALIVDKWKILMDNSKYNSRWTEGPPPGYNVTGKATSVVDCGLKPDKTTHCNETHCLFNLQSDPCEYNDVSSQYPEIYQQMKNKLENYKKGMVQSRKKPGDKTADPRLHGGVWMPWKDITSDARSFRPAIETILLSISAFNFLI